MAHDFTESGSVMAPGQYSLAITPHDTNALAEVVRGIHVGGDGNIAVRFAKATADVTLAVKGGAFYPYRLSHVRSTGTTATGLVGIY